MRARKARRYGRTYVGVGSSEPTSRVCSACGRRDGPRTLHVRKWTAPPRLGEQGGAWGFRREERR
ncbi:zinc ribbon domain-containing protein [Streptomyces sp. NPDC048392]|uniref:zinc ribbon domain-containing protein n=1 Tax=Streptomyces sp. NPDC048392 TaxID=3365543 RepID=UPI0037123491